MVGWHERSGLLNACAEKGTGRGVEAAFQSFSGLEESSGLAGGPWRVRRPSCESSCSSSRLLRLATSDGRSIARLHLQSGAARRLAWSQQATPDSPERWRQDPAEFKSKAKGLLQRSCLTIMWEAGIKGLLSNCDPGRLCWLRTTSTSRQGLAPFVLEIPSPSAASTSGIPRAASSTGLITTLVAAMPPDGLSMATKRISEHSNRDRGGRISPATPSIGDVYTSNSPG